MPEVWAFECNLKGAFDIRMHFLLPTSCRGPFKTEAGPNSDLISSLYEVDIKSGKTLGI